MKIKPLSSLKRHNSQILFGVSGQQDNECSTSKLHFIKQWKSFQASVEIKEKTNIALQNI